MQPLLAFATARPLGGQLADLDVRSEADVQCDGGCRRTGALSIGLWLQTADSGRSECGRSCERQRDAYGVEPSNAAKRLVSSFRLSEDRKSVVGGQSVSVRVDLGWIQHIKKH